MAKETPKISDAEWKVMKLLWRSSPQGAYELSEILCESEGWNSRTVKTMLRRLLNKGAISYRKHKNLYLYYPIVSEERCVTARSESFLSQVFDGSLSSLVVHMAKRKKLSQKEIEKLKEIANQLGER